MPNHFTLTFFPAKGAMYHELAIATVIFSHVKISCFCAKAHLVFHWYLYNKINESLHLSVTVFTEFGNVGF